MTPSVNKGQNAKHKANRTNRDRSEDGEVRESRSKAGTPLWYVETYFMEREQGCNFVCSHPNQQPKNDDPGTRDQLRSSR